MNEVAAEAWLALMADTYMSSHGWEGKSIQHTPVMPTAIPSAFFVFAETFCREPNNSRTTRSWSSAHAKISVGVPSRLFDLRIIES